MSTISPLIANFDYAKAHYETRKAERLTRQGCLDGAIECHEKAANYLSHAMTLSDLNFVQESLICQREHHIRQVWLLQSKIAQLEKYKKKKMNITDEKKSKSFNSLEDEDSQLKSSHIEILRFISSLSVFMMFTLNSSQ